MVAAGVAAGLVTSCFLAGLVGWPLSQKLVAAKRQGWNLVPIVVAAVDLKAGDAVVFDAISQRSIPEQFVSPSMVRPDSASFAANRTLALPLEAGDPLLWSSLDGDAEAAACVQLVEELLQRRAELAPALPRLRDELRRQAKAAAPR